MYGTHSFDSVALQLPLPSVAFSPSSYLAAGSYGSGSTTATEPGRTASDTLTAANSSTSAATPATAFDLPTPPSQYYADEGAPASASTPRSVPPVSFESTASLAHSAASTYNLDGPTHGFGVSTSAGQAGSTYSYLNGTDGSCSSGAQVPLPSVHFSTANYLAAASYGATTATDGGRTASDPLADSGASTATPAMGLSLPTPPSQYYADEVDAPAASTSCGNTSTTRLDDRS
ncbi:hypothetical protein OF846_000734 [Rhodotorula toruloides]|nr:hypothetical protein OF846_000734 [Rhodotorula toruloides]